jgi:hypothetical protein
MEWSDKTMFMAKALYEANPCLYDAHYHNQSIVSHTVRSCLIVLSFRFTFAKQNPAYKYDMVDQRRRRLASYRPVCIVCRYSVYPRRVFIAVKTSIIWQLTFMFGTAKLVGFKDGRRSTMRTIFIGAFAHNIPTNHYHHNRTNYTWRQRLSPRRARHQILPATYT